MSTWRKRFSRRSQRLNEPNEILLNNTLKYRKKLQTAITQINRTKKSSQQNLDSPDSSIHVARLINDIGQLSDCKSLQEISSLIDSLAMRQQLSLRIYNEYAMNSLQQSLQKLNNNLSNDFDKTKSVFEESITNHCSDHTKKQLFNKVQTEWHKHQKLATKELKHGLSSYCDIGLYNLRIQTAILEKLQNFIDELPHDGTDTNTSLPDFSNRSSQARKDIDTMLRIMLDTAPNDSSLLPNVKRPKFLTDQLPLSSTLYSPEITEAAARSHGQSLRQQNAQIIPQYPSIPPPSASAMATAQTPQHESVMMTPITPHNNQFQNLTNDDHLPSYTDLFVVPSSCKQTRIQRRSPRINS
ncbi:unnamed protein product [Adineta steineri]|uniref:Uncharacterized protein n=1 Tax=Adineta steineri TaxID=433720 RepID=A0A818HWN8_9BILA|nr:unnamed protein product [Adineta steineri]CAF3512502.1 unnamed protein product [Adineta steineri]